jgi:hypothetical protein
MSHKRRSVANLQTGQVRGVLAPPAEFIIDRGGVIRRAHRYQCCEDYPPVSVLQGAVNAAR